MTCHWYYVNYYYLCHHQVVDNEPSHQLGYLAALLKGVSDPGLKVKLAERADKLLAG